MHIKKIITHLIAYLPGLLLYYISTWKADTTPFLKLSNEQGDFWQQLHGIIYPIRIQIVIGFWVICLILSSLIHLFSKQRGGLRNALTNIMAHSFKDDVTEYRITLYKEVFGFRAFFSCLVKVLYHGISHYKARTLWYQLIKLPWKPWGKYLVVFVRRGQPHQSGTSTYFRVPNHKKDLDGIVSAARLRERTVTRSLPDLDLEQLRQCNCEYNIPKEIRKDVEKYIKDGYIKDFNRLKTFHRLPTSLWATPVCDKDKKIWGILVIDGVGKIDYSSTQTKRDLRFGIKVLEGGIQDVA